MVDGGMVPYFSVKKILVFILTFLQHSPSLRVKNACFLSPEISHLENEVALIRCVTSVLF